jgi:glutamate dehydrogenase/leucine dehydrogenase
MTWHACSLQIPKYAFVAKGFLQPERIIQFRVSWRDDANIYRINRGFRVQVRPTQVAFCLPYTNL